MTCEACRAAFAHPNGKEIASKLHAATAEACGCEKFRLAAESPGIVEDAETLNLILTDPQSIKNGKSPHPGVLVQIDTFGLSVLRDAASNEEFERTIQDLIQRSKKRGQERFFHGVCSFRAEEIRYEGQGRFLCVYDTALPDKPHHADVFGPDLSATATEQISNSEQERRKRARIKEFIDRVERRFTPAANFRDGAFFIHTRVGSAA